MVSRDRRGSQDLRPDTERFLAADPLRSDRGTRASGELIRRRRAVEWNGVRDAGARVLDDGPREVFGVLVEAVHALGHEGLAELAEGVDVGPDVFLGVLHRDRPLLLVTGGHEDAAVDHPGV